jgi:hypothetical protein
MEYNYMNMSIFKKITISSVFFISSIVLFNKYNKIFLGKENNKNMLEPSYGVTFIETNDNNTVKLIIYPKKQ